MGIAADKADEPPTTTMIMHWYWGACSYKEVHGAGWQEEEGTKRGG